MRAVVLAGWCLACRFPAQTPYSSSTTITSRWASQDNNDLEEVSDAEALLACQAYLVRKKKIDWKAGEERRQRRQRVQESAEEDSLLGLGSTGFFWEDLSQLPNSYHSRIGESISTVDTTEPVDLSGKTESAGKDWVLVDGSGMELSGDETEDDRGDDDDDDDVFDEGSEVWETALTPPDTARQFSLHVDDEQEEESDDFSAIDGKPTPLHIRRSEAAKKRWADPEWKARWYEKRWGKQRSAKQYRIERKVERTQERIRRMNPDQFLKSKELASMSQDEIAKAIQLFVGSNRKRVESRKRTLRERKELIAWNSTAVLEKDEKPLDRDSLLQRDPKELAASKKKRSELAKRTYRKRLPEHKDTFQPSVHTKATSSPLERIESDLELKRFPAIMDVEAILIPRKVAGRKIVLRRILSECFDLRGRCIPTEDDPDSFIFATNCSIQALGEFVLDKLRANRGETE